MTATATATSLCPCASDGAPPKKLLGTPISRMAYLACCEPPIRRLAFPRGRSLLLRERICGSAGLPIAVQQPPLIAILFPASILIRLPPLIFRIRGTRGEIVLQPIRLEQSAAA